MDYASLTAAKDTPGSLAYWLNWAPGAADAPEIVKQAQDEIFSRLRTREMRKALTISLAAGASSAPLPDGFLDLVSIYDPYGCPVRRLSEDRVLAMRSFGDDGAAVLSYPSAYAVFDEAFQFDCAATDPITIRGLYYGANYIQPAVGTLGQPGYVAPVLTNFLTKRYSQLFRAMLLKHGYAFRKDWTAVAPYAQQVEKYLADIAASDDLVYRGLDDGDAESRL